MNWSIMLRLFLLSLIGAAAGNLVIAVLFGLITLGPAAVLASFTLGTIFGTVVNSLFLAGIFAFIAYQRLAVGAPFDLRFVLILGLINGGISLLFGLFGGQGLIADLVVFWQGVAMSVGAYLGLRFLMR